MINDEIAAKAAETIMRSIESERCAVKSEIKQIVITAIKQAKSAPATPTLDEARATIATGVKASWTGEAWGRVASEIAALNEFRVLHGIEDAMDHRLKRTPPTLRRT